jgi:hypothetical protein
VTIPRAGDPLKGTDVAKKVLDNSVDVVNRGKFLGAGFSLAGTYSVPNNAIDDINFDTVDFDIGDWIDTGSSFRNIVVPDDVALVQCACTLFWQQLPATGDSQVILPKINSSYTDPPTVRSSIENQRYISMITGPVAVSSGDILRLAAFQDSGSARLVADVTFSVWKVG